jgi:hypothetical protein
MVSVGGGVGRFVPMVLVVERGGMLQVLDTGKAHQSEPLCLKDRSVLQGINHPKNALRSYAVEMHPEITN